MRVLILADFLPPMPGGLERHAFEEARLLKRRGHEVRAMALRPDGANPLTAQGGIPISLIDGWRARAARFAADPQRAHHPPMADPGVVRRIKAEIRRFHPDVVHAHGWIAFSANAACVEVPLVVTVHDQGMVCARRSLVNEQGEICPGPGDPSVGGTDACRRCAAGQYGKAIGPAVATALNHSTKGLHNVEVFLAVSSQVRDRMLASGRFSADRVGVIPNFFDRRAVATSSVAPRPDWLPDGHFVLAVGDLTRFKGAHVLIEAWRRIDLPAHLVLVGRPGDVALDALPPRTILEGPKAHAEVLAAMRFADVVSVLSIGPEACSTTVMEAMASDAVVVASRTGGTPDLLEDGVSGFLVPPGDVEAAANVLRLALGDTALARRLRAAAGENVAERSAESVIRRIESVLEAVATRKPNPGRAGATQRSPEPLVGSSIPGQFE